MRKYSTNLGFVDLLFNLLVGFCSLLLIAFLLINPIADEGKIDPRSEFLIVATWPDNSVMDIDLWVKGPDGSVVSFKNKDGNWIVLERDDLGISNDFVMVNEKPKKILRNIETTSINAIVSGEYIVNVHHYNTNKTIPSKEIWPVPVKVDIIKLEPYKILYTGKVELTFRQEETIATFVINDDGDLYDIRTDIKIPLYYGGGGDISVTPVQPTTTSPYFSNMNGTENNSDSEGNIP